VRRAERLRIEAQGRELERARAWLKFIAWRARGMGRDLAALALHSNDWPDDIGPGRNHGNRKPNHRR
jgi:hypothetical protein